LSLKKKDIIASGELEIECVGFCMRDVFVPNATTINLTHFKVVLDGLSDALSIEVQDLLKRTTTRHSVSCVLLPLGEDFNVWVYRSLIMLKKENAALLEVLDDLQKRVSDLESAVEG
jgi:hypothetical protein